MSSLCRKILLVILVCLVATGAFAVGTPLYDMADVQKIGNDPSYPLDGYYFLANDIDATTYTSFVPIGSTATPFAGSFDGNGYSITNFSLTGYDEDYNGLFRAIGTTGTVYNLHLVDVNISRRNSYTGALAGTNAGTITTCTVSGNVKYDNYAPYRGGLVGENQSTGIIEACSSSAWVMGRGGCTGGLVGIQRDGGIIRRCHATGDVDGRENVGGLVGYSLGHISQCWASGDVRSNFDAQVGCFTGGLAGVQGGTVEYSFATGDVSGIAPDVGGLMGGSWSDGLTACFATGSVNTSRTRAGGLIGGESDGPMVNCYAAGFVESQNPGGLMGNTPPAPLPTWTACYWDLDTTSRSQAVYGVTAPGTTGLNTTETLVAASYSGWSINSGTPGTANPWLMIEGKTRPWLWHENPTVDFVGYTTSTTSTVVTVNFSQPVPGLDASDIMTTATGLVYLGIDAVPVDPHSYREWKVYLYLRGSGSIEIGCDVGDVGIITTDTLTISGDFPNNSPWYVDVNAPTTATHTGLSWEQALPSIQDAVTSAGLLGGGEIWVADGTYYENIEMSGNVHLYGGFEGYGGAEETMLSERNWTSNTTTVDGGGTDRCFKIAWRQNTRIDGFTITNGWAKTSFPGNTGGGVYYRAGDETNILANCLINNNKADSGSSGSGGGVGCYDANPTITNVTIYNNTADTSYYGGGIYATGSSAKPVLTNCVIISNTAGAGGGVAALSGAHIYLINCTLAGNDATGVTSSGGAIASRASWVDCTNVIIANHSDMAVYEYSDAGRGDYVNCLVFNNTSGLFHRKDSVTFNDANIDTLNTTDTYWIDNSTGDPDFVNTANNDYRITPYGAAFNTGIETDAGPDQLGVTRPQFGAYDIGAYESLHADSGPPKLVVSPASIDLGDQLVNQDQTTSETVHMWNAGATTMTISSYITTNTIEGDYAFTSNIPPWTVLPGEEKQVDVLFDAKDVGTRAGSVHVTTDDPTSPTITVPITGNGTNTRPEAGERVPNHALDFDGSNDYVDCGGAAFFNTSPTLTIEAWIRADTWKSNIWEGTIVSKDENQDGYTLRCGENGRLSFVIRNAEDTAWVEAATSNIMSTNQWHHVAGVYDGNNVRVFVDGVEQNSVDDGSTSGISPSITNLYIGQSPGYSLRYFDGLIDEVRVWNIARNATEIQADMYSHLNGDESGLLGYWRMSEGAGTTTADATANANHGVLMDGPAWVAPFDTPITEIADTFSTTTIVTQDVVLELPGEDADGDTLTAWLTDMPDSTVALIYKYDGSSADHRGVWIETVPANLDNSENRVVFSPRGIVDGPATYTATVSWNVNDGLWTSDNTATHTVTVDQRLDVNFVTDGTVGASISGPTAQTVIYGDDCTTVTANAPQYYEFSHWSESGSTVATTSPLQLKNITAPTTLTANFVALPWYTVQFQTDGTPGASIDGATSQTVFGGTDCTTVTANAPQYYEFSHWSESGSTVATTNPLQLKDITAPTTLTANFVALPWYTVQFQTDGTPGASIDGATSQTVFGGTDCTTVTANAPVGYDFSHWSEGAADVGTTNPLQLRNVTESTVLTANFTVPPGLRVTITSPTVDMIVSHDRDIMTIEGIANAGGDPVEVVGYRVNGSKWKAATGTSDWSCTVALVYGDNTIKIIARDIAKNLSPIETRVIHRTPAAAARDWDLYR